MPAGIVAPVNENPNTVPVAPTETLKPAASAEPPAAEAPVSPEIENWNPATTSSLFIKISIDVSVTSPIDKL